MRVHPADERGEDEVVESDPAQVEDTEGLRNLHEAIKNNKHLVLRSLLSSENENVVKAKDDCGRNILHIAVQHSSEETIRLLLQHRPDFVLEDDEESLKPMHYLIHRDSEYKRVLELLLRVGGVDVNASSPKGSLLCRAAARGNLHLMQCLLKGVKADRTVKNCKGETAMHLAIRNGHRESFEFLSDSCRDLLKEVNDKNQSCFHYLALYTTWEVECMDNLDPDSKKSIIDKKDTDGQTALHTAIMHKNRAFVDAVMSALDTETKLKALRCTNSNGRSSLELMFDAMPGHAKAILSECIEKLPSGELQFDFRLLQEHDDMKDSSCGRCLQNWQNWSTPKQALDLLTDLKHKDLLAHPLIKLMVWQKWRRALGFYLPFLCFYIAFIGTLSALMLTADPSVTDDQPCMPNTTIEGSWVWDPSLGWVITGLAVVGLLLDIVYIAVIFSVGLKHQSLDSAAHVILDLVTYVSSLVFIMDVTSCGLPASWQWQLGAGTLLLGWLNLLLYFRKVPILDIHFIMVLTICKTFLPYCAAYLLFVLMFALSFNAVLRNQQAFATLPLSLFKTWVMTTGELEFTDTFLDHHDNDDVSSQVYFPEVTYVIYVCFLVLMPLIVMNLLTGLAVRDVNQLLEASTHTRAATQLKLALAFEYALPTVTRKKLRKEKETLNSGNRQRPGFLIKLLYGPLNPSAIVDEGESIVRSRDLPSVETDIQTQLEDFKNLIRAERDETDVQTELKEIKNMISAERTEKDVQTELKEIKDMISAERTEKDVQTELKEIKDMISAERTEKDVQTELKEIKDMISVERTEKDVQTELKEIKDMISAERAEKDVQTQLEELKDMIGNMRPHIEVHVQAEKGTQTESNGPKDGTGDARADENTQTESNKLKGGTGNVPAQKDVQIHFKKLENMIRTMRAEGDTQPHIKELRDMIMEIKAMIDVLYERGKHTQPREMRRLSYEKTHFTERDRQFHRK